MRLTFSICVSITDDGILRSSEFEGLHWDEEDRFAPLGDILKVHEWTYIRQIQVSCSYQHIAAYEIQSSDTPNKSEPAVVTPNWEKSTFPEQSV